MVALRGTVRAVGLVSIVVLARLLTPADFGLVAMASAILAAAELLKNFSFSVTLVQKQDARREHFDTVFTLTVAMGLTVSLLLVLVAQPAATFYGDDRLVLIIYWLALGTAIESFQNVGLVLFQKNLELHKEFWFVVCTKLFGFVVVLVAALTLQSYWALIIGTVSGKAFSTALSYIVQSYRPRFCLTARREILSFSYWLFLNNIISTIYNRAADFIIGRISGARALGLFTLGSEIAMLPATDMVAAINRAVFPGYAKISDDLTNVKEGFLRVIAVIAVFIIPAGIGLMAVAEELVLVLLGEKWKDCIPVLKIMSFFGIISGLQSNISYVLLACGRPRLLTMLSGAHMLILVPALIWSTTQFGIVGSAASVLGAALVMIFPIYSILFRILSLRVTDYISRLWRPVVSASIMFILIHHFRINAEAFHLTPGTLLMFAMEVIAGVLSYVGGLLALWWLAGKPYGAETFLIRSAMIALQRNEST